MCDWRKWIWPGILATILLTALAAWWKGPVVEQDLTAKTLNDLSAQHAWAEVELDGRDLVLKGTAPTEEARAQAAAIAENAYDVRVVSDQTELLPEQKPYLFKATKGDGKLILSGYVPNEQERVATVEAASASAADLEVVDELQLARGAPEGFATATTFAIGQLGRLSSGEASLSDMTLSVSGQALDNDSYNAARAELSGDLPASLTLGSEAIDPVGISPYTWGANYDGTNLTLSGYVPSEETRQSIIADAQAKLPNAQISDEMELGLGEGDVYGPATGFVFDRFSEFERGTASLSDADLSISGEATDVDAYEAGISALENGKPAGLNIVSQDIAAASVSPYALELSKSEGVITMTGFTPDVASGKALEEELAGSHPDARIVNRLRVASGVPEGMDWSSAASTVASAITGLRQGNASLNNDRFSIEGMAASTEAFTETKMMVSGDLNGGIELARENITPPVIDPYEWSIERTADKVVLGGYVPDAETAANNVSLLEGRFGDLEVEDAQQIAAGTPRNFEGAVSSAVQAVSRLENASASLLGTQLSVTGDALTGAAANEVRTQVANSLPPGFSGTSDISVKRITPADFVDANTCQTQLNAVLENNTIQFETAKADIKPDSYGLLDRLAFAAQRCPSSEVEIGGHTDSDGSEEFNQQLSQERADAVRNYLVRAGIFVSRLKSVGYGETSPIADNSTDEGKAANRRIEFVIK